jgi:uncharacterized protein
MGADCYTLRVTVEEIVRNRLGVEPERIAEFCRKWQIKELSLFGSAMGDDFRPDSDVDLLVTFGNPKRSFGAWGGELDEMEEELVRLFSRPVDFIRRESIERSPNYIRRRSILENAVALYAE